MSFRDWFHPLRPLSSKSKEPHIMAFDTEDNGTGAPQNFICGCIYEGEGENNQHVFWVRDDMRRHIFKQHLRSTVAVAHNLRYDLDNLDYPEMTAERLYARTRLIGAIWHYGDKKQMRILDTSNFFVGASIHLLGEQLGYKKLGCKCEKSDMDEFGTCRICEMFCVDYLRNKEKWKIPTQARRNIEEYCMRDAEICYKTIKKLMDMTYENKTRFKCFTAPSLACRIFRTNYMEKPWYKRSMRINDIERLAYYGGRTEVFDYRYFERVYAEDIRSSYPKAMHDEIYPYPSNYHIVTLPLNDALKYEGVSLVRVRVPPMHIPPLPCRREDGKLVFPTGEWTAAYTHPELRMALRHGVEILSCNQSIIYPDTFRPFTSYVGNFYQKKDTTKGIEREFYKLLLNGLSGKWGEKRIATLTLRKDDPEIIKQLCQCSASTGVDPLPHPGTNICSVCNLPSLSYSMVEANETHISIQNSRQADPKNAFPILIAYITAYGRIKLFEDRLSQGNNGRTIIYGDTDSCMSDNKFSLNVGPSLGDWEQLTYERFLAYAPKYYIYGHKIMENGEKKTGTLKLKGVPKRHVVVYHCTLCFGDMAYTPEEIWKTNGGFCCNCGIQLDESTKLYKFERPLKTAEALRRHLNPNMWITVTKHVSHLDDKRIKHRDGTSSALSLSGRDYPTFDSLLAPATQPLTPNILMPSTNIQSQPQQPI